jgi:4'-phosphopantetheinyl transferase
VARAETQALRPAEHSALALCRTDKRRAELTAGRLAAHRALELLAPGLEPEVQARAEGLLDAGRPVFPAAPEVALSISHSAGWAVAAVARGGPLGVDLELRVQAGDAFASEAFAPGELEGYAAPCAGRMDPLTAAWALKEAVLKVWGVGLRAPLQRVAVQPRVLAAGDAGVELALRIDAAELPAAIGRPPSTLAALLLPLAGDRVLAIAG